MSLALAAIPLSNMETHAHSTTTHARKHIISPSACLDARTLLNQRIISLDHGNTVHRWPHSICKYCCDEQYVNLFISISISENNRVLRKEEQDKYNFRTGEKKQVGWGAWGFVGTTQARAGNTRGSPARVRIYDNIKYPRAREQRD